MVDWMSSSSDAIANSISRDISLLLRLQENNPTLKYALPVDCLN